MNSLVLKNIGRFIFLWLLQIIILNYVQLPYGMQLYIYILFILLLPHQTPNWLLLLLAFFSGLSVDIFTGMLGLQAAAATFMAFLR
ncbi:MAG: rod shape-determining protein MreD, partial [Bacteroidales bacterium]